LDGPIDPGGQCRGSISTTLRTTGLGSSLLKSVSNIQLRAFSF